MSNSKFRCFTESEDAVTYRAEVSGTVSTSPSQIVNYIEDWLMEQPLVTFEVTLIPIDSSCQVLVSSFKDPECNSQASEFPTAAVGGVISAVILLIVFIIIVLVCIWHCHTRQTESIHFVKNKLSAL